jgi:Flp pilus assembly pilin Flp
MRWFRRFHQFGRRDEATTSVEYAVMLAMILLVLITAVAGFGSAGNGMFGNINNQMQSHGIN